MIEASHLSIRDPRFRQVDPYALQFDEPFKLDQFEKSIFGGIEPDKKNVGYRTNSAGQVINTYKNEYEPENLKVFANRAKSLYSTNPAVTRETNNLIKSGNYVDLQPFYQKLYPNKNIQNAEPSDITAAFALSLKQLGKTVESAPVFRPSSQNPQNEYSPEEHLDRIITESPNPVDFTSKGKPISGIQIDLPEVLKNKYGMKQGNTTMKPNYFVITKNKGTVYPIYVQGQTKSGNEEIETGDPISVVNDLLPAMGEEFAGKGFLKKNFPTRINTNPSSSTGNTLADRMRKNKK
jgi:hypothetical protein